MADSYEDIVSKMWFWDSQAFLLLEESECQGILYGLDLLLGCFCTRNCMRIAQESFVVPVQFTCRSVHCDFSLLILAEIALHQKYHAISCGQKHCVCDLCLGCR